MKLLDNIIALFNQDMRSALELGKLNAIWEKFNNGESVTDELLSHKWKYHIEKVKLLLSFERLAKK